jgi:hypothetical protein
MNAIDTSTSPAETNAEAKTQRGRPFRPGESGNPKGRPKGSRNKATLAVEATLEAEADAIARKAVEKALEGDLPAIRLCLERLLPPKRERPVAFDLPNIRTPADGVSASYDILAACAEGTLLPGEAKEVLDLIAAHVRMVELHPPRPPIGENRDRDRARRDELESLRLDGRLTPLESAEFAELKAAFADEDRDLIRKMRLESSVGPLTEPEIADLIELRKRFPNALQIRGPKPTANKKPAEK